MRYIVPLTNKRVQLEGGDVINEFIDHFFGSGIGGFNNSLITDLMTKTNRLHSSSSQFLNSDIRENEDGYTLNIEIPGVDKKDINIDYENETLIISGLRHSFDSEEDSSKLISNELYNGEFKRHIYVGEVDFDNAKAAYNNGILSIQLPKIPSQKPKRLTIK